MGRNYPRVTNPDQCMLCLGGISNGFSFYGPFDWESDAISFAEFMGFQDSWWVTSLSPVQCDEKGNWVDNR